MAICKLSEKGTIIKNLIGFNTVFLLIFSAVNGSLSIQSVLNQDSGLGVLSSTVAFTAQLFTCIVLPQIIVDLIGFKWTMVLSEIFYSLYIAANIYPKNYTLLPGSVLMGLGQSLAWTVLGMYMQVLSTNYSKITKTPFAAVQNMFFGVFGSLFMLASCLGSILIALILKPEDQSVQYPNSTIFENASSIKEPYDYAKYCGFNNCPTDKLPGTSSKPTLFSVYVLCGAMISLCILAIIITILFVDNVTINDGDNTKSKRNKITISIIGSRLKQEILSLLKLLQTIDLFLLLPISIYTGYELTFMWTEFNRAFVSCLAGVNYIGWTNIVYGATGAFSSFFLGYIAKYITRFPIIIFVITISLGISLFVITWTPNPNAIIVLFFVYMAFALVQSVTTGQVRGLYGIQFPTNSGAYSAATLSQTIGFICGFASSIYMCTNSKNFVYLGLCFLSLICYCALQVKNSHNEQKLLKSSEKETDKAIEMDEKVSLFIEEKN